MKSDREISSDIRNRSGSPTGTRSRHAMTCKALHTVPDGIEAPHPERATFTSVGIDGENLCSIYLKRNERQMRLELQVLRNPVVRRA